MTGSHMVRRVSRPTAFKVDYRLEDLGREKDFLFESTSCFMLRLPSAKADEVV